MTLANRFPRLKGTVFLVTYGRSGSTLLSRILRTVPDMCFRGENYNTLSHLYRAHAAALKSSMTQGNTPRDECSPWYGADLIEPDGFAKTLIDGFIEQILQPEQSARWIGFKEIRYYELGDSLHAYLDFIRAYFPNARFVFNTRSWRDVAKSAWYVRKPEDEVRRLVETMDARFAEYCDQHPEISVSVEYERYASDVRSLKTVFDLLQEDFNLQKCTETAQHYLTH